MNEQNLQPIQKGQLSKEEAKARGSVGGKKSGEVRRQRKQFKESLEMLLQMRVPEKTANNLKKLLPKLKDKDLNCQNAILVSLMKAAMNGNVKAVELIRDTIGEKPINISQITGADGSPLIQKVYITPQEKNDTDKHIDEIIES